MNYYKKYLLCFLAFYSFGQTDCYNDVNTNPSNPANNVLPKLQNGNIDERYLNKFNWFKVDPNTGEYMDNFCLNMLFSGVNIPEMGNILNSTIEYYNYLSPTYLDTDGTVKAVHPLNNNGWELMMLNLGQYPAGEDPDNLLPIINGDLPSLPYIVIYNRYTGVLRVFVNFGLDKDIHNYADAMKITLKFEDGTANYSGLLRLGNGVDQTLDVETNIKTITSIAKAPQQGKEWASTDFQLTYDPCTCYYPSKLILTFKQIKNSSIGLLGRSVTLDNQPLINNQDLTVNPTDFLSNIEYEVNGGQVDKNGLIMYKSMVNMINGYYEKYKEYNKVLVSNGEHNKNVKRNLAILKMTKFVVGCFASPPTALASIADNINLRNVTMTNMAQELAMQEELNLTSQEITEYYEGLGPQHSWFEIVKSLPKSIVKSIETGDKIIDTEQLFKVATQIFGEKASTFIANNFVEKNPPKAPDVPTASFTEMHFKGQITVEGVEQGPDFYMPGTYGSAATGFPTITRFHEYPIYNEVLGTFALLESPKIKISKTTTDTFSKSEKSLFNEQGLIYNDNILLSTYGTIWGAKSYIYQNWTKNYQIQLAEDLKYTFNSSLDIKKTNIQASFRIISKHKLLSQLNASGSNYSYIDPTFTTNLISENADVEKYEKLFGLNSGYSYSTFEEGENHFLQGSSYYPAAGGKLKDSVILSTPYVNVNAFKGIVSSIGVKNEYIDSRSTMLDQSAPYYPIFNPPTNWWDSGSWSNIPDVNNLLVNNPPLINESITGMELDFDIEVKLIVDIEFNTINQFGVTNKITQLLTFIIPNDSDHMIWQSTDIIPNLEGSVNDITQYPENISFENTNFNGSQIEGCKLVGNQYTCQAWNNVTINGELTTSNGYHVNIFAGNEIEKLPESEVSPEIVLDIHQILDYSHPMPESDPTDVYNFCKGLISGAPSYQGNSPSGKIKQQMATQDSLNQLNQNLAASKKPFDFTLYPNPAKSSTRIVLENYDSRTTTFLLTDVMGKNVEIKTNSISDNTVSLDVSTLEKGIYFVTVKSDFQEKTKQLLVE